MASMLADSISADSGLASSVRSLMVPLRAITNTELLFTLVEADSLASMPTSEIIIKIPVTVRKMAMPQMVASVILRNCFILPVV